MIESSPLKIFEKRSIDTLFLFLGFGFGPFYLFPKDQWLWILPVFPILCAVRWIFDKKCFRQSPISGAMALLMVCVFLGLINRADNSISTAKLAGLSYGILMFLALLTFANSKKRIRIIVALFLLGGMIVAGIGTISRLQTLNASQLNEKNFFNIIPRVIIKFDQAETGINPNPLGGTLLLFIPLGMMAIALLSKKKNEFAKQSHRYLLLLGIAIIIISEVVALIYSRSSGAWLAFGLILVMMGQKKRLYKACLGLAVIFAGFIILESPEFSKNIIIKNVRESLNASALGRLPVWKGGIDTVRAHPVLGLGLDRLRKTSQLSYEIEHVKGEYAHAHNQFIHIAAEAGMPALIAYLSILIGAVWMAVEVARSKMPKWMILSMRGLGWGQIGFAVFGIADAIPLGAKPGIFFWTSLAMMTSIYLYGRENGMIGIKNKNVEANV